MATIGDLLKTDEVLEILRISRSTLYRLTQAGKIGRISIGPKAVRYRREEIERFLKESEIEAKKAKALNESLPPRRLLKQGLPEPRKASCCNYSMTSFRVPNGA